MEEKNSQKDSKNNPECEQNKTENFEMGSVMLDEDVGSAKNDRQREDSPAKEENSEERMEKEGIEAKQAETLVGEYSSDAKEEPDASEDAGNVTMEKGQSPKGSSGHFLFKCLINVKKEGDDALAEMHWVEGQNRDLMNQLCTYLRNQIFRLVAS